MGKMYRTSKGQMIDMDALRLSSEKSPAVGNMNTNGRGDKLGRGGKTEATVEQQTRAYYKHNPKAQPKKVSIKEDVDESTEEIESIKENMPEEKPKAKTKKKKIISKKQEVELEDGSIQIVEKEVEDNEGD
jgi:hypothetical protein